MSLSTNDRDYELEKETIEFKSEDVGQEEGMLEEIKKYLDESDDIANATPDSLTSPGDVLNNEDHEWQEDCAEEANIQEDDEQTDVKEKHTDEASEKINFDFAHVEDDESSGGTEPESVVGESSSEDFADYYSDIPLPDDSDAPPERRNTSTLNNSSDTPKSTNEEEAEDDLPKMFSTNAGIKGDYYGIYFEKEKGVFEFKPLGRAIFLKNVIKDITNNTYSYVVSFQTETEIFEQTISKEDAMNIRTIQTLCKYGADIPQKHVNVVIDSLRAQEELNFIKKQRCSFIHTDLGWQEYFDVKNCEKKYLFKAASTTGDNLPARSKYEGNMAVRTHGNFELWKRMVRDHVLGHPALETILIAALSSVVVGLIGGDRLGGESPILHFADSSSNGKTTAAMLAASVGGRPFKNSCISSKTGKIQESLCQDWGGTQNAIIAKQRGNKGYPIILDELSKVGKTDLTTLVYFFSEGTEKSRMNEQKGAGFMSSTVSFGEVSLIEQCRSKNEGLRVRVLEVSGQLTDSAAHSDTIKRLCQENYGFAIKWLAKFILKKGGKDYVIGKFDKVKEVYFDEMPDCLNKDRLFNKFHGTYLTTALLAKKAFGIEFDLESIFGFLNTHIEKRIEFGNSSQNAYEQLLEKFRANQHHISFKGADSDKKVECWGSYSGKAEVTADGKKIIGEYSIRVNLFAKILRDLGFENKDTIIKDFKKLGYLNYENGRDTRRRKIGSDTAELCYVIRVFEVEASEDDVYEEIKPALQVTKNQFGTYYIGIGNSNAKYLTNKQTETLLA